MVRNALAVGISVYIARVENQAIVFTVNYFHFFFKFKSISG